MQRGIEMIFTEWHGHLQIKTRTYGGDCAKNNNKPIDNNLHILPPKKIIYSHHKRYWVKLTKKTPLFFCESVEMNNFEKNHEEIR